MQLSFRGVSDHGGRPRLSNDNLSGGLLHGVNRLAFKALSPGERVGREAAG